ncbi:MAG TPA: ABC transporter substrate-binding protein [Afifellaceae bacterium]|nr:ABC transporter substrate-binding protein [Afifellaceae bacterium]
MLALAVSFTCSSSAFAEDGVSDDRILFGQAAALDGPASALGRGMRLGILAAFEETNREGGISGRKLELISYDDGYEPDRSIKQTRQLIETDKVFGLIGPVGTPTSAATQPIATEAKVPFIGPFTGAGFLRNAALGNVINVRATYAAETEEWIRYLVDEQKMTRIAILYQDDAFGRVGLNGVTAALAKRKMELVAKSTYQRNTTAVKVALLDIRKAKPDAVVMVGAYKPISEFIKLAKSIRFEPTFVNISFVGSAALARELGTQGEGVIVSQVVPFPWDTSIPVVRDYQAALRAVEADAKPDFVSLEGYLVGRLTTMALRKMDSDVTRQKFLRTIWSTGTFDLGGVELTFSQDDNQGSGDVFMTRIARDGRFLPIELPLN